MEAGYSNVARGFALLIMEAQPGTGQIQGEIKLTFALSSLCSNLVVLLGFQLM